MQIKRRLRRFVRTLEPLAMYGLCGVALLTVGYFACPLWHSRQAAVETVPEVLISTDTLAVAQNGSTVSICDIVGGETYTLTTQTKLNLGATGEVVASPYVASTLADSETVCIMSAQGVILIVDKTIGEYYLLYNS